MDFYIFFQISSFLGLGNFKTLFCFLIFCVFLGFSVISHRRLVVRIKFIKLNSVRDRYDGWLVLILKTTIEL